MSVGGLSYSIYVWQQLFLPPTPPGSPFPWNILAAVAVALSSYYLVERPCLKLKNRFIGTKVGLPMKVAAPALTHCLSSGVQVQGNVERLGAEDEYRTTLTKP
jgi:peptidoglycan/LPS O-acetylase OafA/YrhL